MRTVVVRPGDLVTLDPSDKRVVQFDWDTENLSALATIVTSTFTIQPSRGYLNVLTKDNESILAGDRKTQVRLDATTSRAGHYYRLSNQITTNESPAQIKEQSVKILVQHR